MLVREKELGPDDPLTMKARYYLASLERSQDNLEKAELQFKALLTDQSRVLTKKHVDTIRSMRALADVYRQRQNNTEAEILLEETLQLCRECLPPNHPATFATMNNLAQLYRSRNKVERALQLYSELIPEASKVFDQQHPCLLLYKNNQAVCYMVLKKYDQAEAILRDVLHSYEILLGLDHKNTLVVNSNIASLLLKKGNISGAIAIFEVILPKFIRKTGKTSTDTMNVMEGLGRAYLADKQTDRSLSILNELLQITKIQSDFDEKRYIRIMYIVVSIYEKEDNYMAAKKLLQESLGVPRLSKPEAEKINNTIKNYIRR